MIAYPGAVHQWDGGMQRRLIGRNISACRFDVAHDAAIWDSRTRLPMTGPHTRGTILAPCPPRPYPIGRGDALRVLSNRDFGRGPCNVSCSDACQCGSTSACRSSVRCKMI